MPKAGPGTLVTITMPSVEVSKANMTHKCVVYLLVQLKFILWKCLSFPPEPNGCISLSLAFPPSFLLV